MGKFKVIGIRANNDCSKGYTKVLVKEKIYSFYPNYQFDSKTDVIEVKKSIEGLYNLKNVEVSVSAIAGKNGTGKSTLMELLFMGVNNLAYLNPDIDTKLNLVDGLDIDIFFETDKLYKISVSSDDYKVYGYDENLKIKKEPEINFNMKDFFYSVVINYSQYALNTNDLGDWLDGLFHKNDGYQTPMVINPMRDKGNFDINTENSLAVARLITNLARPITKKEINFRQITEHLSASILRLRVNKNSKANVVLYKLIKSSEKTDNGTRTSAEETIPIKLIDLNIDKLEMLRTLDKVFPFNFNEEEFLALEDDILPFNKLLYDYLFYKLVSVAVTYSTYSEFFNKEERRFVSGKFETYLRQVLIEDTSHVAFKLKQTLNMLKFQHLDFNIQNITLDRLSKRLDKIIGDEKNELAEENRIELIPPPIFEIEIILESDKQKKGKKDVVEFSTLSSGEKQLVYSVSSVLYHLINLDSVINGFKYRYINVILDEIELYFHPEYQKKYIKHILESVERLPFKNLEGINFIFITHSPFILSDIPNTNILFLELNKEGYSEQIEMAEETFCSNIHSLLAHSFFMTKGYMGEFATEKVKNVVEILKKHSHEKGDKMSEDLKKKVSNIIEIVGEPLLKQKLLDMLSETTQFEQIDKRVERLERELREAKLEQLEINKEK